MAAARRHRATPTAARDRLKSAHVHAHVERRVKTHRKRRSENVGRAQARGASNETKNLGLRRGVSKASVVQERVSDIVVPLRAGSRGAAERMRRSRLQDSPAAALARERLFSVVRS